jgi:hypothetical protein
MNHKMMEWMGMSMQEKKLGTCLNALWRDFVARSFQNGSIVCTQ